MNLSVVQQRKIRVPLTNVATAHLRIRPYPDSDRTPDIAGPHYGDEGKVDCPPIVAVGYLAPFRLHDVVQVVVLPPMQDLQTLTHWLICFAS